MVKNCLAKFAKFIEQFHKISNTAEYKLFNAFTNYKLVLEVNRMHLNLGLRGVELANPSFYECSRWFHRSSCLSLIVTYDAD